jgi:hypothetical protein
MMEQRDAEERQGKQDEIDGNTEKLGQRAGHSLGSAHRGCDKQE